MATKTLIVYELIPEETRLYLVDGDKSYLHGCFVNYNDDEFPEETMTEICEAQWGEPLVSSQSKDTPVKIDAETIVVVCGFGL